MAKKQVTKKKPINVQLSKEDLVELLTAVKDLMSEELTFRNKRLFLNQSEMGERISRLEKRIDERKIFIPRPVYHPSYCPHDDKLDCISYSRLTGAFLSANYKCSRCGRENRKAWCFLTRKEKKALNTLGVTIK